MYDYYYQQWGTFTNVDAVDSVIYQSKHTYLSTNNKIRQQSTDSYLDGGRPVLMQFTTSWLKLTNLQGFQRVYYFYLLSNYLTPHKLAVNMAYDYNQSSQQTSIISPSNFGGTWGSDAVWGDSATWGGSSSVEQWRVFTQLQKCQSIQISVQELYDPTKDIPAGAGLTFSGINLVVGAKKGYPTLPAKNSVG
jgi:hypothetical protein